MAKVKFAPLRIPLHRRLETLAISIHIVSFLFLPIVGGILLMYLTWNYPDIAILYLTWLHYDWETPSQGGRKSNWIRNWRMWKYYSDYFPMRLVKTAELDPGKNYLFALHPHGALAISGFLHFATNATGIDDMFPGMECTLTTLQGLFTAPFFRDYFLFSGACVASKESLRYLLTRCGLGNVAVLIIGGAEEALYAKPGNYTLKLNNRMGFIKTVIMSGSSLVPVFSFGENEIFDQPDLRVGSKTWKFQHLIKSLTRFTVPLIQGRGIFQYSFGLIPYRRPVHTVVGTPIDVVQSDKPSREDISTLHSKYLVALNQLFDKHKVKYGVEENVKLNII